jgi:hypothetical protein
VMIGGAAVVLALGGVAIAVQTGALPHPFRSASTASAPRPSTATHAVPRAPESPPGAVGAPPPTHTAAGVHSAPTSSTRPSSSSAHTTGAPAVPGLKGLCESYVKAARQGRKLDVPSQARLEQAAGGASEVDAYCARLTGATVVHGGSSAASSQASSSPAAKATALRSSGHGQARTRPLS